MLALPQFLSVRERKPYASSDYEYSIYNPLSLALRLKDFSGLFFLFGLKWHLEYLSLICSQKCQIVEL